ncbi:FAD/NAD(P)-binding domain-containing protein [Massarina eburnea CBS 473.64]|uniref:FAD/NAD(P)-binding domain-containing protein n=1 Tax=Massarina eburnea CBS 473.64 TaxID=1395130 RepID=A0A6A6RNE1_9PLEO|nr:FAD/NAD(P)-binding domain-containing protein [Massarina eburnea CBS 473.64]
MPPTQPLQILISGGGIAGTALAYWLLQAQTPLEITIIERSPGPRPGGQAVDIRDSGVTVIRRMGIEQAIRDKTTTEKGIDFVYRDGVSTARFPMTGDTESQSFTSEFEILRGDLADILEKNLGEIDGKGRVEWVFDEFVREVVEVDGGRVRVKFMNHSKEREFDLVVGADGMVSKTRRLVWGDGPGGMQFLKRVGQYMSFFTIKKEVGDTAFSPWYFTNKGRLAVTRPSPYDDRRVLLAVTDSNMSRFVGIEKAMKEGPEKQKQWLAKEFEGAGWITERLIKGMWETKDFYIQEIAQVKMGEEGWVKGRVALCGDAGYCPSPISGMGTTSALVGAYILAGEISKSPDDIPHALKRHQELLQPFIDEVQKLYPGTPWIVNPQSEWGIKVLNMAVTVASNTWVKWIGGSLGGMIGKFIGGKPWELPRYSAFD